MTNVTAENILKKLLTFPSITPNNAGSFDFIEEFLLSLDFKVSRKIFKEKNEADVENLYARLGDKKPHFLFSGHVDVVPPGDKNLWKHPPFAAHVQNDFLYGRGAVDMKGGIAAFLAAISQYLVNQKKIGSISIALTSDEEGPSINGTRKLLKWCNENGEKWDAALVGEPTCDKKLGDSIKIGRRGSLSGILTVIGQQGHAAYPSKCSNPLTALNVIIQNLLSENLDEGTCDFQKSNLEFTSIDTGNEATNVIPEKVCAKFNIRYNSIWIEKTLKKHIEDKIKNSIKSYNTEKKIDYQLQWQKIPTEAFLTTNEKLINTLKQAIFKVCSVQAKTSTAGGTSDARFVQNYCPVVEFGPRGTTMHQINEAIPLDELDNLTKIYTEFLKNYFEE